MFTVFHKGGFLALALASIYLTSCGEKPVITSYHVVKEYDKAGLIWKTPEGWTVDVNSTVSTGTSFIIEGKNGLVGKVAGMPFGPEVTMLDVANMFGRELGLGFLTKENLSAITEKKTLGQHEIEIARLGGDDNTTAQQRSATIALLPAENETWLLMMIAEAALAQEQRPKFEEFLASLTVLSPKVNPENSESDSFFNPPASTEPPPFTPPPAPIAKPAWEVPEDWKEQPIAGPRVGSFAVQGAGDAMLDISVTSFPGSMGGPLANLNRWRGQLGLDATDSLKPGDELKVDGRTAVLVDLQNEERGMLAVMILDEERSWFVKAMGDAALAKTQKANFEAFVGSIRFNAP